MALTLFEVTYRLLIKSSSTAHVIDDRPAFYYKPETSNSMQDFHFTKKKAKNIFRIAVLGDSFSFAPFMQFDDAFPKKLERMLNLNESALKAEVINFGVPGYSTRNELSSLVKAFKYHSDLIILQITLNDSQIKLPTTGLTGENQFGAFTPPENWQRIYRYWQSAGFISERIHNFQTKDAYVNYYFDLVNRKRSWKSFSKALRKIGRLSRRRDIPVVAVIFPLFGLPLDDNYPFHPVHEKFQLALQENEIPYLDLFKLYKGLPLERLQVIPGVDFHPNEIAHRMAAEEIYTWMAKNSYLPEKFQIKELYRKRINIIPKRNYKILSLPKSDS